MRFFLYFTQFALTLSPTMAKKKHTEDLSEQLLFSPIEMLGEDEQAAPSEPEKKEVKEVKKETETPATMPTADNEPDVIDPERLLTEMTIVMEYLDTISVGKCRMIAMETAALWHNGVKMNGRYTIQNMPERTIDGYKFLALYYCSFFKVFPNMIEKLGLPYEDICLKALERYNGYKQKP